MAVNPDIIEIDSEGDVELKLASREGDQEKATNLIVASKILTLSSPVFDKMLNSTFKEGVAKKSEDKATICLPEDDPEAMTIVCQILHHKNHLVPGHLDTTLLEKIAVLCNKYDCTIALTAHSKVWILYGLDSHPSACDLDRLLFAAYLLDIPLEFGRVACELVSTHKGRIVDLQVTEPALFPDQVLGK